MSQSRNQDRPGSTMGISWFSDSLEEIRQILLKKQSICNETWCFLILSITSWFLDLDVQLYAHIHILGRNSIKPWGAKITNSTILRVVADLIVGFWPGRWVGWVMIQRGSETRINTPKNTGVGQTCGGICQVVISTVQKMTFSYLFSHTHEFSGKLFRNFLKN